MPSTAVKNPSRTGWDRFYQRRDAVDTALTAARRKASGALEFIDIPEVNAAFGSRRELLLAMHHRWMRLLTGYVNTALDELDTGTGRTDDAAEAVEGAWRRAAAERPVLLRVLRENEQHADGELMAAYDRERRMLALAAGLSSPEEPAADTAAVGRTYQALLTLAPPHKRRARLCGASRVPRERARAC